MNAQVMTETYSDNLEHLHDRIALLAIQSRVVGATLGIVSPATVELIVDVTIEQIRRLLRDEGSVYLPEIGALRYGEPLSRFGAQEADDDSI